MARQAAKRCAARLWRSASEKRAYRTDRKDAGSVQPDIMPCIPDPGLHHSCRYVIDGRCDWQIHGGKQDDAFLPDRLFQGLKGLKMASGIFSRISRFFYFYRIECPVLMNEQINLFGILIAIVPRNANANNSIGSERVMSVAFSSSDT